MSGAIERVTVPSGFTTQWVDGVHPSEGVSTAAGGFGVGAAARAGAARNASAPAEASNARDSAVASHPVERLAVVERKKMDVTDLVSKLRFPPKSSL